jgi:hypothetical protein
VSLPDKLDKLIKPQGANDFLVWAALRGQSCGLRRRGTGKDGDELNRGEANPGSGIYFRMVAVSPVSGKEQRGTVQYPRKQESKVLRR